MNIYKNKVSIINENNEILTEEMISEAYKSATDKSDFYRRVQLNESKFPILFNELALNEAYSDEGKLFVFESGISIPSVTSKAAGRLTLRSIAKSSDDSTIFVSEASKFVKKYLQVEVTESDIDNLKKAYNELT